MPVTVQQILNMKCMQITGNGRCNQPKFAWKNFVKSQIKRTSLRFIRLEINKTGITVVI